MASTNPPSAPETTVGHTHPVHDASGHVVHDEVAQDHGHTHSHAHEPRHYFKIWGWLVLLFCISVAGPMVGIKWLTLITAFGIAVVKARLVVKHFMHLDVEPPFVHYFLATALVFMFLLFAGVSPDVMNHYGTGWVNVAAKDATARALAEAHAHGDSHGAAAAEHGAAAEHDAAEHATEAAPAPAH